jgi:hypothetical protein
MVRLYDVDVVVCYNCEKSRLPKSILKYETIDQHQFVGKVQPIGVAWKVYPARIDSSRHEICIDNDIILQDRVPQFSTFLESDCVLMLEDIYRAYGRFESFIPPEYVINAGLYGMPPNFDLQKYVDFYIDRWEKNAFGVHDKSETFDEQGLVTMALLSYHSRVVIPNSVVVDSTCKFDPKVAGWHFISLNRCEFHIPFRVYKNRDCKIF